MVAPRGHCTLSAQANCHTACQHACMIMRRYGKSFYRKLFGSSDSHATRSDHDRSTGRHIGCLVVARFKRTKRIAVGAAAATAAEALLTHAGHPGEQPDDAAGHDAQRKEDGAEHDG